MYTAGGGSARPGSQNVNSGAARALFLQIDLSGGFPGRAWMRELPCALSLDSSVATACRISYRDGVKNITSGRNCGRHATPMELLRRTSGGDGAMLKHG